MNKKVFKMMIILTMVFLLSIYIIKLFFPDWFVLTINNNNIISFGKYVDTHHWANILSIYVCGYISYCLYCCACCEKLRLNWKENLIILATITISIIFQYFIPDMNLHFNVCSMFILPLLFKAEFKPTVIVYTIHGLSQLLSLSIRNIGVRMLSFDFASFLIMGIDAYLWLIFLYCYYNLKNKKEG